jgi:hypothetical protein
LNAILQIVPRVPGGLDGVGDYALTIAARLRDKFGVTTVFATPEISSAANVRGFEVRPLRQSFGAKEFDRVILHYVNYGYQKRGVPFGLLSILRQMRQRHTFELLTVFHELYACGPPWRSEFWLHPIQVHITKSIARLSDNCIVSSENFLSELQRLVPDARIRLHPTPSGLEEPLLSPEQISGRDPHRWVIVGGSVLAERSLRSFARAMPLIPEPIAARALIVLGGNENPAIRALLADLGVKSDYRPRIPASEASDFLKTCSYTWIDYFHRPDVETSVVLKSSAFAAACAHAIVPIFPHCGTSISIDGDRLPGPFFVESKGCEVPGADDRPKVAENIYDWYQLHASSDWLVSGIAKMLGLVRSNR